MKEAKLSCRAGRKTENHREVTQLEQLLNGIRKGSRASEDAVVSSLRPTLVAEFRRLGWGHEAEDMAHDALIVLLDKLRNSNLQEPAKVTAYCRGIAANLSIASRRKQARRKTHLDSILIESQASDQPSPELELQRSRLQDQIPELINRLPRTRDQLILRGVFLKEEDKQKVQQQIDVSSSQFDRVLYRSKKRLSELVDRSCPDLKSAVPG